MNESWRRRLRGALGRADDAADLGSSWLRSLRRSTPRLMIEPYLGWGTQDKVYVGGRALQHQLHAKQSAGDSSWRNAAALYRRLASDEVPGARVRARLGRSQQEAVADGEGHFHFEIEPTPALASAGWHTVDLEILDPPSPLGHEARAQAQVLVPPATARFGVISDIDDTVLWSHATDRLRMLALVVRSNVHTRKPFKGVAALYRALQRGAGGDEGNPVFYVSGSPWNLYSPLVEFMTLQGIPVGPLMLEDFGEHTLLAPPDRHHEHKLDCIERILSTYPALPFVLIGDSGEQDPEIYRQVVHDHPNRVRAIYIRSVDPDPSRIDAIDQLTDEVAEAGGAQLVLAPDSEFVAKHALTIGLVAGDALAAVRNDKKHDEQAIAG